MKIIISGTVDIDPEKMSAAMAAGRPLIDGALTQDGCLDYDWCPDPTTEGRIRVFERWASQEALSNHFNNHWYTDMRDAIGSFGLRAADVGQSGFWRPVVHPERSGQDPPAPRHRQPAMSGSGDRDRWWHQAPQRG